MINDYKHKGYKYKPIADEFKGEVEKAKKTIESYNWPNGLKEKLRNTFDYVNGKINTLEEIVYEKNNEEKVYSGFLGIAQAYGSIIKEIEHNGLEVPEEINKLYQDAVKLRTKYSKKIWDSQLEEAKQLIKEGKYNDAILILNNEIWNLETYPMFYQGLKPTRECIDTLTEGLSKELTRLVNERDKYSSRIKNIIRDIKEVKRYSLSRSKTSD